MIYEWLRNIEFGNNWVLPFLGMLPVFGWLHFKTYTSRKAPFTVSSVAKFRTESFKSAIAHLPFILRLLAIGCVILALARPQTRDARSRMKGEGIDIVMCMDVSGSMRSRDFYPDRLEVAKEMAKQFVIARPVDQIGLVIFSGESFTQFPVSTDRQGLLQQIEGLRSGMLQDGTVIGEGLATAVDRLSDSKAKSRVIILLTDGKEEPPDTRLVDPYTALEIAKAKGVKVYTIGMLARASATIQESGRNKDVFIDETLLNRIARETGGAYFRASDQESLLLIYQNIDKLEKTDVEVITRTRFEEQFIPFIVAALILLLLDAILRFTVIRTFP